MATAKRIFAAAGNARSRFNVIALGAVTYDDIWVGRTSPDSTEADAFLCPRIFYIDRHHNVKGELQPMLTAIAQGTAIRAAEYSSNLRIFEPYWLN